MSYSCNLDITDANSMLGYTVQAEKAGFTAIWTADHFHPWFHTGARETQAWIFNTTVLDRTQHVPVGTGLTSPVLRYHPAIIAQVFASMEAIFGKRVFLTLGAGEALNELPLGYEWMTTRERRERVIESVRMIRKLVSEDFVNFKGKYFTLRDANLYMRASFPIYIGASGPKMAEVAGELGDGFLTIKGAEYAKSELFPAIEKGAKKVGKTLADITKVVEIDMSYHLDYDAALTPLRTQAGTLRPEVFVDPIYDPRVIEKMGSQISDSELAKSFVVAQKAEDIIKPIEQAFELGFDHVYVASLSPDEKSFIDLCGQKVLPYFEKRRLSL